ncbi:hypothetical protein [Phenylobacterium sp.]|jgi:hypothetical protein|uniref:hypothetical protein n=1 Tax=Phenylobacterium sp. TaxID=1871053 RepID=UPI002E31AE6E|nr:hypothetical protein [Phenylobacterium sp.]HEX4712696.1 hypothetical protein [Phenylobacterium sp.]
MRDIIDLRGASGATYRFRLWAVGASHLPTAGNYAFVREQATGFAVLAAGAIDDLSQTRSTHGEAAGKGGGTQLFTRLNVARAVRMAEAEDIAAFYGLDAEPARRGGRDA